MSEEDQVSPAPHVSHVARISMILGILSAVSVFLALWGAIVVMKAGILTFLPTGHEYVYPVFWLLWLLLPIGTVICGTYARKTATGQRGQRLALVGLVLGYLSLLLVVAVVFSEITLFLRTLGCLPPHGPCS
jgi:uncharacterized protein YqgC (DUF456 family)